MAFTLGSSSGKNPSALCTLTGIRLGQASQAFEAFRCRGFEHGRVTRAGCRCELQSAWRASVEAFFPLLRPQAKVGPPYGSRSRTPARTVLR